jgi:beta propeller repeat protein
MAKRSKTMKPKLSLIVILLIVSLGSTGVVGADTTITPLTGNNYADTSPRIDGDYVIWQGYVNGNWEIFLYHIASGALEQITFNNFDESAPQIDGNYAVWQGYVNGNWEIFLYEIDDIVSGTLYQITTNSAQDLSPRIAGEWVAWMQVPGPDIDVQEIFLYWIPSLPNLVPIQLTNTGTGKENAILQMDANTLLWAETTDPENTTLHICNLNTQVSVPAPDGYVWTGDTPQRSGTLTVFAQYTAGGSEIFLRDTSTRVLKQITNNSIYDGQPSIGESRTLPTGYDTDEAGAQGNFIVWVGGEGQDSEIYLDFHGAAFTPTVNPTVTAVAQDGAPAAAEDGGGGGGLCFINSMANIGILGED